MSKYIHELVHKMTSREKGYFKKMSTLNGKSDKHYLQLYKYVELNPIYNLQHVNDQFKGSPLGKYLSSEYNYLAEQLMKSLVNFHFEKSDKNKIRKSTLFISILIEKGLRTKALKILNHIKKIAYRNEYFSQVLTLIDFEEEILFKQGILGFTKQLNKLEIERQQLIDKINNLNRFRLMRERIKELWFKEGYLNFNSHKHPLLQDAVLDNEDEALSLRAKEHWHYIVSMREFIYQNHNTAVARFNDGIAFVEKYEYLFIKENLLVYLSNYLYNCALSKNLSSFNIILKRLNNLEETLYTKYINFSRSLEMFYQLKDFKKSEALDNEVFTFVCKHKDQMELTQSNYLYFLLVRNKIIQRDFEKALDYIHFWLQIKLIDYYYLHIKIFSLIVQYELEHYILLKSEINTTYKTLKLYKQYNYVSKKLIAFFKRIIRSPEKELILLTNLKQDLSQENKYENGEKNYKYFDYLIWVDNRIEHCQTLNK